MFPFLVIALAAFVIVLTWLRDAPSEVRALFAEIRLTRDRLAWIAVALVPGATGSSGSAVIREFARHNIAARALVRNAQKAAA